MSGEDIILFALKNPWTPNYSESLMRRFLTEFVSSQKMIFDVGDQNGRLAVAVMLDKVGNLANDACLEILGCRQSADPAQVFLHFVETAKKHIPEGRAGFQVGLPDKFVLSEEELAASGLIHYYDTYKMLRPSLKGLKVTPRSEIVEASSADADVAYELLRGSFAKNPETSIPDETPWKTGFLKTPGSNFYFWKKDGKVLAFAHMASDDGHEFEVRTIGVLPEARNLGVGQALLEHCLAVGAAKGYQSCVLTVAVANESALGLYVRCGFNTIEKFRCFRMPK